MRCESLKVNGLQGYEEVSIVIRNGNERKLLLTEGFCRTQAYTQGFGAASCIASIMERGSDRLALKGSRDGWNGHPDTYSASYAVDYAGRRKIQKFMVYSNLLGKAFVLTTAERKEEDFYAALMKQFDRPIKREWARPILERLKACGYVVEWDEYIVFGNVNHKFSFNGEDIPASELVCLNLYRLNDEILKSIITDLLKEKVIVLSEKAQEPLGIETFDDVLTKYSDRLIASKKFESLAPMKGKLDNVALGSIRYYPQQAAVSNGLVATAKSKKHKYVLLTCQMGTGKTLMGYSGIEEAESQKVLNRHHDKMMIDLYTDPSLMNYRAAVMCPSHLVDKWGRELKEQVKDARVYKITKLKQLVDLRNRGRKPNGKEWYVFSKDFAKLGGTSIPAITKVGKRDFEVEICENCFRNNARTVAKPGNGGKCNCPQCGGSYWKSYKVGDRMYRGMICPDCGKLLYKNSPTIGLGSSESGENPLSKFVLGPEDFAGRRADNSVCVHCGTSLWMADIKTVSSGDTDQVTKKKTRLGEDGTYEKPWYKLTYYGSKAHNTKKTAWVLHGYEQDFLLSKGLTQNDYSVSHANTSNRRFSPSYFIKKYLKGYFDYAVLDEVHKFEGKGSAQSIAAHALSKAARFTIGLTGTLTNGSASSLFSLLFMLNPRRMREMGYTWDDDMAFAKKYGCVETRFEYRGDEDFNSNSRGRQISTPSVKPGISPAIFGDFLIGNTIFLELADMSRYMPECRKAIRLIEPDEEVNDDLNYLMGRLKEVVRTEAGRKNVASILQFGLFYSDKPWGHGPILSGTVADETTGLGVPIAVPVNHEKYLEGELLNKEKQLVLDINKQMAEGRNVFVFASCTNKEEFRITERLKQVIEEHCNLKDRVYILESSSPGAQQREEFIKKKAAEGIRVFITNPKCCETGLDFCFKWEGKQYNFQCIIFYQVSYELAVMMQAAARSWRLNQKEVCDVIYYAYKGTLQQEALRILFKKMESETVLQGDLSASAISGMTSGVDARTALAKSIMENSSFANDNELVDMLDVLNNKKQEVSDIDREYVPPKTFYELIGDGSGEEYDLMFDKDSVNVASEDTSRPTVSETKEEKPKKEEKKSKSRYEMKGLVGIVQYVEEFKKSLLELNDTLALSSGDKKAASKFEKKVSKSQMTLFEALAG